MSRLPGQRCPNCAFSKKKLCTKIMGEFPPDWWCRAYRARNR